jgi:glycerol-3-phosphate dehydrogenase (NAD(P)+)
LDAVLVSLMTGIETRSGMRMSQVIRHVAGIDLERIAVLSGPNLAQETASG